MGNGLPDAFGRIIGESAVMRTLKDTAHKIALGNSTVLLTGETGTGKGQFASAIHRASGRGAGPFIEVNCGAIPENLMESELFGYCKGAFTGALAKGKKGYFQRADGGSIFLDEIGEMPLHLQVKLLHVLQNRCVEPVGGEQSVPVNVRIIAASNQNLETMIEERTFRKDLYFRLGVIPIHIPPLRERREDIPLLAEYLLRGHCAAMGREPLELTDQLVACLQRYSWPGNVRELDNAIEYAINVCQNGLLLARDLPGRVLDEKQDAPLCGTYEEELRKWELALFSACLQQYGSDGEGKKKAAAHLGISLATLYRKIAGLGLDATGNL